MNDPWGTNCRGARAPRGLALALAISAACTPARVAPSAPRQQSPVAEQIEIASPAPAVADQEPTPEKPAPRTAASYDKWRGAITQYVSSVKMGNQTALNGAAVPFARYLNEMHNRIHPIFADTFLGALDGLPANHPMNRQTLVTRVEIVLREDGHIKQMGVLRTSGITAFDIGVLDSIDRAQPFGPVPDAIRSNDGNVYIHWELLRDEAFACSLLKARPFMLTVGTR